VVIKDIYLHQLLLLVRADADRAGKQLFNNVLNGDTASIHLLGTYSGLGFDQGSSRYIIIGYYGYFLSLN
jgi:hypothetical protein